MLVQYLYGHINIDTIIMAGFHALIELYLSTYSTKRPDLLALIHYKKVVLFLFLNKIVKY